MKSTPPTDHSNAPLRFRHESIDMRRRRCHTHGNRVRLVVGGSVLATDLDVLQHVAPCPALAGPLQQVDAVEVPTVTEEQAACEISSGHKSFPGASGGRLVCGHVGVTYVRERTQGNVDRSTIQ